MLSQARNHTPLSDMGTELPGALTGLICACLQGRRRGSAVVFAPRFLRCRARQPLAQLYGTGLRDVLMSP